MDNIPDNTWEIMFIINRFHERVKDLETYSKEYEEYEEETPNIRVSGTQDNKKIRVQDLKNQEPQEVKKENPVVINVHADKKTEQKQVVMTNEQLDNSSTQQDADVKNNDNTIIIDKDINIDKVFVNGKLVK